MSLPSYSATVERPNVLTLLPPYLSRISLLNASLVNKEWNAIFGPYLWSDPIKFIVESKTPYEITSIFFLDTFSSQYRHLVHTFDFRPLKYLPNSTRPDWTNYSYTTTWKFASTFLSCYSNLRFVVLDDRDSSDYELPPELKGRVIISGIPTDLLLFSAKGTPSLDFHNTGDMWYLDFSFAAHGNQWSRILSTGRFDNLCVLKLRGLRLTDSNLPVNRIGSRLRLWSLDIRDNSLTDVAIRSLLNYSFLPLMQAPTSKALSDERFYEDPPLYEAHESSRNASLPFRPDTTSEFIRYILDNGDITQPLPYILPPHDPLTKSTGLTHLYLSGNLITSKGIYTLLSNTNRLQALDVGTTRSSTPGPSNSTSFSLEPNTHTMLARSVGSRMQTLRIHHSLITCSATICSDALSLGYLPSALLSSESAARKLPSEAGWNPLLNNHLHSLTLTSIPTKSYGPIIERLTTFLRLCAQQEKALRSASRRIPNRHAPPLLPGLRSLTLEFLHEKTSSDEIGPSVSGDQDADEFLAQSMGDFSFFGEERGGVGLRKMSLGSVKSGVKSERGSLRGDEEVRDVAEELRVFRRGERGGWSGKLRLVVPRRGLGEE